MSYILKKLVISSAFLVFSFGFTSAKAELYTNFYNNTRETVQVTEVDLGVGGIQTNLKRELQIENGATPPHIWWKPQSVVKSPHRYVTLVSTQDPNNWCRFAIPSGLARSCSKDGCWEVERHYDRASYIITDNGDFHCYIKDLNNNTAHLNLERKSK